VAPVNEVVVKMGWEALADCQCGCGRSHRAISGGVVRGDAQTAFMAILAEHPDPEGSKIWFALGSGPWWPDVDDRECFVNVATWLADGGFRSRVSEPEDSLWQGHELLADAQIRVLTRDEVLDFEPGASWVFATIDAIMSEFEPCRSFLLGG